MGVKVDVYDSDAIAGAQIFDGGQKRIEHHPLGAVRAICFPLWKTPGTDRTDAQVFGPEELRQWVHGLGIETFVGTSGVSSRWG